jgi:HAD superfamily hydrolase (TIGR01450 family)
MQSLETLRRYDVVLCDVDGVLVNGREGVEGVPELLRTLARDGPRVFFLTNNGSALPEQIAAYLGQLGLEIPAASLITAGQVLVDAFRTMGLAGAPILNIGNEPAAEYIRRAGGVPIPAPEARRRHAEARAVVVGSARHLDKNVLDAACNAVHLRRVPVLCTNPDVFAPSSGGEITLVAGGLANLLERELGAEVIRLGKPHRPIWELAQRRMRDVVEGAAPRVLVVDDNLESGILGGAAMGFDTLLVLTGWHRSRGAAEEVMQRLGIRPTYVLDSVVD